MGEAPGSSTHDLLLALAGQVDDDLLAWARELVAVGENTRAIALVTAGITADRTALPGPLRAALVTAASTAHTDLDADAALPEATDTALDHRFVADPSGGDDRVAAAVGALPARLLDGADVLLAWRLTPAGSAPGPLPHPVVLVEVAPGGRPADVLAYQLSVALDRSGVVASVEVLTSGHPLSEYHLAARDAARRIDGTAPTVAAAEPEATGLATPDTAVSEPDVSEPALSEPSPPLSGYADLWAAEGPYVVPAEPAEPDAAATDPTGDVVGEITPAPRPLPLRPARDAAPDEPEPRPAPRPFERRRTTVTPLTRSALPSPVPLARRDGSKVRPLLRVTDETPADDGTTAESAAEATDQEWAVPPNGGDAFSSLEQGQIPALADTPMFRSMQDPLSGPLNAPLLAPLLDPTPVDEQSGPAEGEDDDPFGLHGVSPLAPDRPTPVPTRVEDRWASEWASGDWALSSSDLEPAPVDRDEGPDEDEAPDEDEDEAPRHRATSGRAHEPPVPQPVSEPEPPRAPSPFTPSLPADTPSSGARPTGVQSPGTQFPAAQFPAAQLPPAASPAPLAQPTPIAQPTPFPHPTPFAPPTPFAQPTPPAPPTRSEPPSTRPPEPPHAPARPAATHTPQPAREEPVAEDLGLRPDSVARLSDADRELLARLQAELGTGTRPHSSRRAGVAAPNGSGSAPDRAAPNGNGPGRHDPPDLAG